MLILRRTAVALFVICFACSALADPPYLRILSRPPQDLTSRSASLEDLAKFAWQEFLALNWKASIDSRHPPSASNPRGTPDLTWSYGMDAPKYPNPLVWQTYAQTTELRPNSPLTTPWASLVAPQYSYGIPPVQGAGSFTLWNNLDEDNEIGSCNIYGQFAQQLSRRNLVLFQVKVNRDEYEYIRKNYGSTQHIGAPPYTPPNAPKVQPCPNGALLCQAEANVIKNILNPEHAYYPGATSTCDCPPTQAICLPCGRLPAAGSAAMEGTIEVKSAWRLLLPGDDPSRFYTTTAIYYDTNGDGQIAWYNDTFALVGMHIIHKTTKFPDFVFATFEQVDVESSDTHYATLNQNTSTPTEDLPFVQVHRQTGQTKRQQLHPVPQTLDEVTRKVRAQLKSMNPKTVWQHYRLTGVYGASTDVPSNPTAPPPPPPLLPTTATVNCVTNQDATAATNINPNYYMANFMIESDPFLNNFSGPGFANSGNGIFPGGCQNTVYNNTLFNNGGCKGCHGVAQTAFGTDFSFLLDFGNNKPSIQPATIHFVGAEIGSAAAPAARKLKHYLGMVKVLNP